MIRSTTVRTLVVATAGLTALGLVAAAPATAHTNSLFSYIDDSNPEIVPDFQGFTALNKADGVATPLSQAPLQANGEYYVAGIEVSGEKGAVLGYNSDLGGFVSEWNHSTGVVGIPMATYLTGSEEQLEYTGLDTLNNGTTVTIVFYDDGIDSVPMYHIAIASVDVGSGELKPLIDFRDALVIEDEVDYAVNSLATDPATGITYVFLQNDADESFFLPVDVAANTVGNPTLFQGEGFGHGVGSYTGAIFGADFDPGDGSLYFLYESDLDEELQLSRLGKPADWVNATRQVISSAPAQSDTYALAENALTAETPSLANTGTELPVAALVLGGTLAVAGGVTLAVARRRREAGTV